MVVVSCQTSWRQTEFRFQTDLMPFDFNEFLTLAEELAGKGDEASKRSSISRAYYTAYHLAFPRAETNVGPWRNRANRKLGTHAWCWQQYIDTNDANCQQIGV